MEKFYKKLFTGQQSTGTKLLKICLIDCNKQKKIRYRFLYRTEALMRNISVAGKVPTWYSASVVTTYKFLVWYISGVIFKFLCVLFYGWLS